MARHKFQSTFTDGNGRVVGTATTADGVAGTISIYLAGTTTAASVYTASSGGTAVNSVTTDTHGHFYFWVDEDDYTIPQKFKIVLSHSDFESKTYDNLDILKVSAATASLAGIVELDTGAETIAGIDTTRAITADGLAYTLQRGTMQYVADTAANDTYVATLVPAIDAYVDGMEVRFKAKTANTGACTLNINGKGAKAIKKHRDQDTVTGDIEAGQIVTVVYDLSNTVWQMQSQLAIPGDVTAAANIADNKVVTGAGGAKGVKESPVSISDTGIVTGLGNNAIPPEAIADGLEQALLSDATKGRNFRMSYLVIEDGTNANTIKCTLTNIFNGDTIAVTDNIAKNATTGHYTLSADGTYFSIENAGLSGSVLSVMGTMSVQYGHGLTWINSRIMQSGSDIQVLIYADKIGNGVDWTTISGGRMDFTLLYITDV